MIAIGCAKVHYVKEAAEPTLSVQLNIVIHAVYCESVLKFRYIFAILLISDLKQFNSIIKVLQISNLNMIIYDFSAKILNIALF